MLYEDNEGNLLMPADINQLSPEEIQERGIHVSPRFE